MKKTVLGQQYHFWFKQALIATDWKHVWGVLWVNLNECQSPTKAALSLPFLNWTGQKKNMTKATPASLQPPFR